MYEVIDEACDHTESRVVRVLSLGQRILPSMVRKEWVWPTSQRVSAKDAILQDLAQPPKYSEVLNNVENCVDDVPWHRQ